MPIPSVPKLILANLLVGLIIYLSGGSLGCFPLPLFVLCTRNDTRTRFRVHVVRGFH